MGKLKNNNDGLLTREELAEKLGLTKRGVDSLANRRKIPVLKISHRCVRYDWAAVREALEKYNQEEI